MLSRYTGNTICTFTKYMKNGLPVTLRPIEHTMGELTLVRHITKHWDPKWKKFRREKVIKIDIPNFYEKRKDPDEMTKEEMRTEMKKKGIVPPRPWQEMPVFLSSTGSVMDPYIPPEGDGRFSTITKEGAKQRIEVIGRKGKSFMALKTVKKYDENFDSADFPEEALGVYVKAHEALANNRDDLDLYVTERAIPEVLHNAEGKTIHWKFIESLEPARIVHARTIDVMSKRHIFVQITVRFHTQQLLAIYDRFGRLMYGSEILKKDVLEYVVFEKQLTFEHGSWRIHGKIIPPWMPSRDVSEKTFIQPPPEPEALSASKAVAETATVAEIKDKQPSV